MQIGRRYRSIRLGSVTARHGSVKPHPGIESRTAPLLYSIEHEFPGSRGLSSSKFDRYGLRDDQPPHHVISHPCCSQAGGRTATCAQAAPVGRPAAAVRVGVRIRQGGRSCRAAIDGKTRFRHCNLGRGRLVPPYFENTVKKCLWSDQKSTHPSVRQKGVYRPVVQGQRSRVQHNPDFSPYPKAIAAASTPSLFVGT